MSDEEAQWTVIPIYENRIAEDGAMGRPQLEGLTPGFMYSTDILHSREPEAGEEYDVHVPALSQEARSVAEVLLRLNSAWTEQRKASVAMAASLKLALPLYAADYAGRKTEASCRLLINDLETPLNIASVAYTKSSDSMIQAKMMGPELDPDEDQPDFSRRPVVTTVGLLVSGNSFLLCEYKRG